MEKLHQMPLDGTLVVCSLTRFGETFPCKIATSLVTSLVILISSESLPSCLDFLDSSNLSVAAIYDLAGERQE